ncbi:hypothetical protein, variant [Verruconis gallopava]|uniref:Centromere protein X n=1 Tax=Verruconis gallopava TaxID=253628 RepID=A0A0D1YG51_9PEZI|nr:uncharacterized protein PV09_08671 [Verruconis gallopava]XP_016209621.1 hypothetical protein, variant [Verruconis gallopava]KIV99750.1 hypothetical protein PV09_08671 [Verruconis gallopava]KIV99751.1 hypothetical protein, variant [Verruconis gallopava]
MKYTERLFPDLSQSIGSLHTSSEGTKKRVIPFKAPSRIGSTSQPASTKPRSGRSTSKNSMVNRMARDITSAAKSESNSLRRTSTTAVELSSDDESERDTPPSKKRRVNHKARNDEYGENNQEDEYEDDPVSAHKHQPKPATRDHDTSSALPPKLLTRLLYENFEDKNMKIGKEAMKVLGKYVETFVREALARAIYEREDGDTELGKEASDGFLQVEDLEKLAPQLLLDF